MPQTLTADAKGHARPKPVPALQHAAATQAAAGPRPAKPPLPAAYQYPPAPPARARWRHRAVALSFLLLVAMPVAVSGWYLWTRAADQYASRVGFSVRTEEASSAIEILGGITEFSGSSSSDTDILHEFLQSQALVAAIDRELDLRAIWSGPDPARDPVFAFHAPGTIEDLLDHWARMVRISHDGASGLIELRVLAFAPEDAQRVAEAIFEASSAMINDLSAIAREDAIGYARADLAEAETRLAQARLALTAFRNRTQIVDPTIDTQGQMGLVATLQAQLAEALIELDLLRETTRESDPRIAQAERRIAVIEDRIGQERAVIGRGGTDGQAYADLVGEYERLVLDQEFAQEAYWVALASYDAARNEARRQSRYLAAHVRPTLAEAPEYPQRALLLGMIGLFLFLGWSVVVLVAYSLRDRR